ncbi:putative minor capsid protein [Firmicutes bacterium CAG:646]|nr:putative minor capsid protein [Firmicutes bacterium CAG:646]
MPAKVKVEIHKPRAMAKIRAAGNQGLTDVRDEIIDDINRYVPKSGGSPQNGGGGDLRRSAELHSDQQAKDGNLKVRWDTPYAQYQHEGKVMHGTPKTRTYGPEQLKYTEPMARKEWEQYAERKHGADWSLAIEEAMKSHMR